MKFLSIVLLVALSACSSKHKPQEVPVVAAETDSSRTNSDQWTKGWPETAKLAAHSMISKYGPPKEATPSMLIWEKTGPFKRTIVYKQETSHRFPFAHKDVLEQVVDYRVPAAKVDELFKFNGSLKIDRTRGELSSRCDKEAMNLLALNLADEVIRDMRSVEDARKEFASAAQTYMIGNANRYNTALMFTPAAETFDADLKMKNLSDMKGSLQADDAIQAEEAQGSLESDNLELE
ncbi:MAG TPA: hypothetical protein VNJ08_00780 [Bacteriovoracaceae bacterium]|nr:hypothetical protein [Bacteriovoracaceae bacterium]